MTTSTMVPGDRQSMREGVDERVVSTEDRLRADGEEAFG